MSKLFVLGGNQAYDYQSLCVRDMPEADSEADLENMICYLACELGPHSVSKREE